MRSSPIHNGKVVADCNFFRYLFKSPYIGPTPSPATAQELSVVKFLDHILSEHAMPSTIFDGLIFIALVSASALAGLMTALLVVMRKIWAGQTDAQAANSFKEFLGQAARNRVLSTLSVLPIVCPLVAIFYHPERSGQLRFALVGCGIFLLGFYLWTGVFNLPIYRAVDRWDLTKTPDDVRAWLRRFHTANAVRLSASLCASAFFFAAS
jgi:uncharacterized membrane protein